MSKRRNESASRSEDADDELAVLRKISRHLQILVGLNLQTVGGNRSQRDMIVLLDSVGCAQKEIAGLLGTTSNTVNVALWKAKRKSKT